MAELILFCASVGDDVLSSTTIIISLRFKGRSLVELVVSVAPILVSGFLLHSPSLWLHMQLIMKYDECRNHPPYSQLK